MNLIHAIAICAAVAATMTISTAVQAASIVVGTFKGNDCKAGAFSKCYATQTGTQQGAPTSPEALGSPAIYKFDPGGTDFGSFATVSGSEFFVNYVSNTNTLSFTYTPGSGDPSIHYFAVKQANSYTLFYDVNAITAGTINLSTYFQKNPGYSHITFFDTGVRGVPAVPEPATWAMMLIGFGMIGFGLRRRTEQQVRITYA